MECIKEAMVCIEEEGGGVYEGMVEGLGEKVVGFLEKEGGGNIIRMVEFLKKLIKVLEGGELFFPSPFVLLHNQKPETSFIFSIQTIPLPSYVF